MAETGLGGDGFMGKQFGGKADVVADKLDGFTDFGTAFVQAASDLFANHFSEAFLVLGKAVGKLLQEGGALDNA